MKYLIYVVLIVYAFAKADNLQAQGPHDWQEDYRNVFVDFNSDRSLLFIATPDHISIWKASDGTMVSNTPLFYDGLKMDAEDIEFVDASPDLTQLLFKYKGSYNMYKVADAGIMTFPKFDPNKYKLKEILGFTQGNFVVFKSEGNTPGFHKFKRENRTDTFLTYSPQFSGFATMMDDDHVAYWRDGGWWIQNMINGIATNLELDLNRIQVRGTPEGMTRFWQYDESKDAGKRSTASYWYTHEDGMGKKLRGKKANMSYPLDYAECVQDISTYQIYFVGDTYFRIHHNEKYGGQSSYELQQYSAKDCSKLPVRILFSKSSEEVLPELKKIQEDKKALQVIKREEEKQAIAARRERDRELAPQHYAEFKQKFVNLPTTWKLDRNTLRGVDITSLAHVRKQTSLNSDIYAIGSLSRCEDGSIVVLMLYETSRSSGRSVTKSIMVETYDADGKRVDQQRVAVDQKDNGNLSVRSEVTITTAAGSWVARTTEIRGSAQPRSIRYSGSCR